MNEKLENLLEEEIESEINNLGCLSPGSEEHSNAVESLTKLYKLKIEETQNERDHIEKCKEMAVAESEHRLKVSQLAEQVRDRYFRVGVEAAGIVLPLVFYAVWMRKGFKFEETGTFTSTTFRGLIQKFKPTKK